MVWSLYQQSQAYNVRPSILLGVEDKLASFYLDRGIHWFCKFVEGEMDKASSRAGKRKKNPQPFITSARIRTYNKLMGIQDSTAGFRSVSKPVA